MFRAARLIWRKLVICDPANIFWRWILEFLYIFTNVGFLVLDGDSLKCPQYNLITVLLYIFSPYLSVLITSACQGDEKSGAFYIMRPPPPPPYQGFVPLPGSDKGIALLSLIIQAVVYFLRSALYMSRRDRIFIVRIWAGARAYAM